MIIEDPVILTITRFSDGHAVNGIWVKGRKTILSITSSIPQPLSPREMLILPEGERTRERMKIFTASQMQTADESSQTMGDRFTWNGRDYEVQQCEPWNGEDGNFYKAIGVLVEKDTREVKMQVNLNVFQSTVGLTSTRILAVNANRKYLKIENKNPEKAAKVKFGVDFLTPTTEVQKIVFSAVPTSGTWQIIANGNSLNVTAELAFNANAAAVQAQIRTLPQCGSVTVAGDYTNGFTFTWGGDDLYSPEALLQTIGNSLASNANQAQEVQNVIFSATPDAGVFRLILNGLETADIAFGSTNVDVQSAVDAEGWPAVTVTDYGRGDFGFVFTFTSDSAQNMISVSKNTLTISSGEQDEIQVLYGTAIPNTGTYQLQYAGQMTAAINFDADSTAIENALNALSNLGAGCVVVTGTDLVSGFQIDFQSGLVPAGALPLVTVWNNLLAREEVGDLNLSVFETQVGIGPVITDATVARTTPGHGNDTVTATVSETTPGIADTDEGMGIPAGQFVQYSFAVPMQEVYAKGETDGVQLEVSEG